MRNPIPTVYRLEVYDHPVNDAFYVAESTTPFLLPRRGDLIRIGISRFNDNENGRLVRVYGVEHILSDHEDHHVQSVMIFAADAPDTSDERLKGA
jgi:hypothetical protein